MNFFYFSTCRFFLYFVAFGLRPLALVFHGFILAFNLHLLYCILLRLVKGRRVYSLMDFFVFRLAASFCILLPLV